MRIACLPAALAAISFVVGCREPTGEAARVGASFAVSGPAACPAPPSTSDTLASYVTVTDEASLVAAVGSAKPFGVIPLDGFLPVSADGARLTNNTVACGVGECAFFVGTRNAVVADNSFASAGSSTGIHMQAGIDGSRVERNSIVATAPSGGALLGGIRVRDGSDVVVADNIVRGPWGNSIATTNLAGSHFENNRLAGATAYGVRFGAVLMTHNAFGNNQVSGAGSAAIFVQWACNNTFLGNNLEGNGRSPSAIFDATTGANVLVLVGAKNLVIANA